MNKIREGYKVTELGEIPNEWSIMKLSEIAEINPRREVLEDKDTVSFIAMEDITNNGRVINKTDKLYEEVKKGYTPFKDNDVLLAKITPCFENGKRALVGKLSNGIGFGSTEFHVLRANKESISKFLYYVISSHRFMSKAENNMTGSAGQKRVPTEFIKDYVLAVPTIKEQEKIASILSTIDEQIDNVDALIEKNKELKKGLMQTLLTKGIGHTKFKKTEIGEIPEEWEVGTLSSIIDKNRKITYGIVQPGEYVECGKYVIRAKDYSFGWVRVEEIFKCDRLVEKSYARARVKEGDVLLTIVGSVGNLAIVPSVLNEANITQQTARLSFDKNKVNNVFYYNYLKSDRAIKEINKYMKSGVQPSLNLSDVEKFKIVIPSIEEQERISLILSSVDEKVEQYENKKQKLEELKKGLMQQLLTGKIRVN